MRRVPIRLKLAAALSVPLFALAVVTTIEVINSAEEVDKVRSQTELARSVTGPNGLITALQDERTWPAVDLIGQGDAVRVNVAGYDETRQQTDEALANFREELSSKADAIARAYAPALEQLEAELPGIRADIDHNVATVPNRTVDNNIDFSHQIFDRYTAVIEPFFDATTRISLAVDDPELRQGTELADAAAREYETMSLLLNRVIGYATTSPGGLDQPQEIADVSILHARFRLLADTLTSGTGPYAEIADQYFPHELVANVNEQVDRAVTTGQFDLGVLLDAVNVPEEEGFLIFQEAIKDEIEARSNELESAAERRQQLFLLLAAVVVGAAVVLAWLVSRSITRPLRALTREAKDMAERRLPEAVTDILQTPLGEDVAVPHVRPVRVNARDEVADVADALNTVQDTALDLAVEQAVLRRNIADSFVNLGRRNQNLLGRQLDFITELESKETDPDTLANLFRLDHLATRMRRNAESLLVLAGVEPPRKWAAPVRLTDVIRAALGEVEDYQRVTVRGVEPATIVGSAAADVAHLLAELIENALVFSPPDQTVDIRGRGNDDGGYTLAIIDSGLGMSPEDIAAANRRLAGLESFTIAPSKYLGHYVAGNLAARHGIKVRLDNSPGNGITATVELPPSLLTAEQAPAQADEPHAARDVWPPTPASAPPAEQASLPPATPERTGPSGPPAGGWQPPGQQPSEPQRSPEPQRPSDSQAPSRGPSQPQVSWADSRAAASTQRTPSGLVKRAPRVVDTGEMRALAAQPDETVLDSISRVTARHSASPSEPQAPATGGPAAGGYGQPGHTGQPAPTGRFGQPGQGGPSSPFDQGARPGQGGQYGQPGQTGQHDRLGQLAQLAKFGQARQGGANGPTGPSGPSSPFGQGRSGPSGPFGQPAQPSQPAPPAQPGQPGHAGATPSGLTRRVRGAQMPTTSPLQVRRSPASGSQPSGPQTSGSQPSSPAPGGSAGEPSRNRADEVYNLLANFTAGVQRGLDHARTRRPDDQG